MKLFFRIIFKVFLVLSIIAGCATTERITERKKNEHQKYALLIGGGITDSDNYESFYTNIEYVSNTLKQMGYRDEDIIILFYGGKTPYHPIVEGSATKKNFIDELSRLGDIIDSNDSLVIFRSGHGMVELICEKHDKFSDYENRFGTESIKCAGTVAVMNFPDGNLSCFEFQEILGRIKGKQIVIILNQCFCGQFTDIAMNLHKTVVVSETRETELAINQTRKTIRWRYIEWPFVKCFFDGFLQYIDTTGKKQSVFDAFQYMLRCNPNIEGIPIKADRPLLKENPKIKYGRELKIGTVYID
jgi:hypothetical protein